MAKAYWINSVNQTVIDVEYFTVEDMRRFIGGYICIAYVDHSTGDTLYVDDEGLLKEQNNYFMFSKRMDQPLAGNGLYVGAEIETESGFTTIPPTLSIEKLRRMVIFMELYQH